MGVVLTPQSVLVDNSVTNAKLAQAPALTVKGNSSGITANEADITISTLLGLLGIRVGNFGDASDGNGVMDGVSTVVAHSLVSGTYTPTRSCHFNNLTISSGAVWKPDGYPHDVAGILTNNGDINSNGGNASGNTRGEPSSASSLRPLPVGKIGGDSANPGADGTLVPRDFVTGVAAGGLGENVAVSGKAPNGSNGGIGQGGGGGGGGSNVGTGSGGNGAASGFSTPPVDGRDGDVHTKDQAISGRNAANTPYSCGSSGGGGGLGALGLGVPGAGGGCGGWVVLNVFLFAGAGTYRARGGNGADGTLSAGGGGAGPGGVFVICTADPNPPTASVSGGLGGVGGGGSAPLGQPGGDGGAGGSGISLVFR